MKCEYGLESDPPLDKATADYIIKMIARMATDARPTNEIDAMFSDAAEGKV
jgi:hypothetical protein